MGLSNKNYDEADIALSAFALALALPVRIFIIRKITEQGNSATRDDFQVAAFHAETIDKHLQQLKKLHILKSENLNKKVYYSINGVLFKTMSTHFSLFMNSFELMEPQTTRVVSEAGKDKQRPIENFGAYLKNQRQSFQLTQDEFALRLDIDRPLLSKIENGKTVFPEDKLLFLSRVIHEKIDDIKNIYFSDHLVKLIRDGNVNDAVFETAKLKAQK